MSNIKINRELGTKWFTFYTKVRPWFACIAALSIIVDFSQNSFLYYNYWWMMLYFFSSFAQPIAAILVLIFVKNNDDYADFIRFVKGVLIFETINIAYQQGVKQYINTGFNLGWAFFMFIVILVAAYFLWYRLNVKYFEKRILIETPDVTPSPEIFNSGKNDFNYSTSIKDDVPIRRNTYNVSDEDILDTLYKVKSPQPNNNYIQKDEISNCNSNNRIGFCRKCGNNLIEGSLFCNKCGTKICSCRKCGNNLIEGSLFCNKCGTRIDPTVV